MYRKKGRSWTKHIDFMLLDVLCMQIAFIVSYICRFGLNNPYIDKDYRILAVAFLLIDFFVEIVSDAFKNVLKRGYLDEFIVTCKHVALVEIITTFFLFTTQMGEIYSRMSYYIMIPIYILVSYLGRMVLKKIIKKRGFASSKESLFVIAPEKLLRETLQGLKENGFGYTQIVAAATDADLNGKTICEIPIVANHDGIVDYACEEWVDEVLIPPCAESEYPYEMADIFLEMGIAVHRGITKNKVMAGSFNQIEKIGDYTVITASLNYARTTQLLAKRGMDILGGLVGCIITLIVTIFVGPAIYIASPGPIFFAQERIGRNGRKFKMYKFRSMYMDAEERKKELMAQNKVSDGMMFKMDFDPRIIGNKILSDGTKETGIGQFIRKTSIDELPQFWNILKGDMSLVGTRPPTLDEWEKYEPHHRARMSFRPGLTGLWQVSGRSNITDFEEVVRLDTQYIGEWSVKNDIKQAILSIINRIIRLISRFPLATILTADDCFWQIVFIFILAKFKPFVFNNPSPRSFAVGIVHCCVALEIRLVQCFRFKANRTIFQRTQLIIKISINRSSVHNLIGQCIQLGLVLQIVCVQTNLNTIQQICNHLRITTNRNTLIKCIEIVVIKSQTNWKALNNKRWQLFTIAPPLLFSVAFDKFLIDITTHK